ncbi:MAG: hypothetical protein ACI4O9_08070 [Akkermansia sp.]
MNINKQDIEKITSAAESRWGAWAKYLIGAIIGALAAAGVLTVTSCTITTQQAQDLRTIDALLHQYGTLIIQVDDTK